jgi:outer membrane protein assembly factor BamB
VVRWASAILLVGAVAAVALASQALATTALAVGWTTYHGSNSRAGSATEPAVRILRAAWRSPTLDGAMYAEPLWLGGRVYVATENDSVYALSLKTGRVIWRRHLGTPVPRADLPCGNINPLGITGTPVIRGDRLYVAVERLPVQHRLFALRLATGQVVGSWSLDLGLRGSDPVAQQQRAALTAFDGAIYVPLGGLYGDCGTYVGQVIAIRPGRAPLRYRVPTTREGAIWGTSGLAVDEGDLYAATGNSASDSRWDGGDSVLRLSPDLRLIGHFAPDDFAHLNEADLDLGSTGPLPVAGGRLFEIGKQGIGYLLSASHLGGVGHPLDSAQVCDGAYGADAYADGRIYVPCTNGLVALALRRRGFTVAWRGPSWPAGPPVVGGQAVFTVDEANASLVVLSATDGRTIAVRPLPAAVPFDAPTLAPDLVLVPAGTAVLAFSLARPCRPEFCRR